MSSKPKKVLSQAVPSYSKICSAQHVKSADGKIAGLYDLEETIGKGHYAVVKLARHVFTGEKVAVKVIDKTKLDEVSRAHLFQEVRCMKLVQHPHVVRLYEVIDTATKLYLVLEWGDGGDMYDYIMKHDRGLQESMARRYFAQIVQAIDYCHQLHVVHRDLKPENVVFFETATPEAGGIVKLTDFGFSNKFVPGRKLETSCGSLAYSAPEILLGDSYDAPAVDVWSLGVILYMLVCGEPPFQEANDSETLTMIMDCNYRMPPHISPLCQDIIGKMLVREPSQRATICDIARHPWMLEEGNLISPSFVTPLVCRESLTDEDHCHIVQRIVEGKIASTEEIASSLDSSAYNHITATYFLLAERLLRKRKEAAAAISSESTSGVRQDLKPVLSPLGPLTRSNPSSKEVDASGDGLSVVGNYQDSLDPLLSPLHPLPAAAAAAAILNVVPPPPPHSPSPTAANLHSEINLLVCRCALIHEDSAEGGESAEEETGVTTINQSQSDSELIADEEGSELAELGYMSSRTYGGLLDVPSSSSRNASKQLGAGAVSGRPLVSVRSSPQLLNEICEEAEHDDDADSRSRLHDMMQLQQPMSHNSRRNSTDTTHRRSERFHRVHHRSIGLATTRVPSCSSSDASDTDDVEQRAAAGKQPQQKQKVSTSAKCYSNLPRRDSSEHSSDNDNLPTGRQVGGGGGGDSGSLQSRGTPCGGKGRHLSDRERHSGGGGGGKQTTNWCAAASSSADRLANDGSGSDNRRQSADAVAAGELNGLSSSYISTASVLKRHLEDVESMSLPQCYDDDDHYIPESEDYFGDEKSRAASDGLSPKSQWLSNVIRFHSMEFSRMIDHHHPGKSKVKNVTKARCHSTVDIGCRDSRIMAAALFAKLSCIDMVERRSHSVSCLRVRKVSM